MDETVRAQSLSDLMDLPSKPIFTFRRRAQDIIKKGLPILLVCGLSKFCKEILNWKTRLRNPPNLPEGVKKFRDREMGSGTMSRGREKFACQKRH